MMPSKPPVNIITATADTNLFASWFANRETWAPWFAFLAALFAIGMTPGQRAIYEKCTGRSDLPEIAASEAWLICGRRAGKSFILALVAVFLACFHDYRRYLQPGERGTIMVIAADRKQARTIMRYIGGLLRGVPMLRRLIESETRESFDLSNGISIEVGTASFKSLRGYTIVAALCDEIAFWPSDNSAEPDYEILNALRPAMATIPNAMLLCASSPYARKGALWHTHRKYFGQPGPVLVWQAATRIMNATVPQSVIDAAMERDPASASAEYLAHFRSDVESLLSREAIEACVSPGVRERPYIPRLNYRAFIDPSGGSADSMTLAIGHREGDGLILDAVRERRPPFSPDDVVSEFAATLKEYKINTVVGDRYAGVWVREPFRKHGISYDLSEQTKSDLYRDLLPLVNSKVLDLLDHDRLANQLIGLERRTARGGKESIDHGPGSHDDIANSVAGVAALLSRKFSSYDDSLSWVMNRPDGSQPHKSIKEFMEATAPKRAALRGGAVIMEN
jgi:hypothetical protein